MPDRRPLKAYLMLVGLAGLVLTVLSCASAGWAALSLDPGTRLLVPLVAILALGELRPIMVTRGAGDAEEISIASSVGMSLVLVAPIGLVVVAQALALLLDELRRLRSGEVRRASLLTRTSFNVGQYALAFVAARAVFCAVEGQPFVLRTENFSPGMLTGAWLAAATFFLINSWLTSAAFALSQRASITRMLSHDWRWQIASSATLLGLGPVIAQAVIWSVWLLPFLLLPLVLVHRGATLAARREHEALHDQLTGLPNRGLLRAHLDSLLLDHSGALILLDLDHFKEVNDTLGHLVGDGLLRAVGTRLSTVLGHGHMLARLGGDEFAVVAAGLDRVTAEELAGLLIAALVEPAEVDGFALQAGASAGVALWPEHGDSVESLMQHADIALYSAKELRGGASIYEPTDDTHSIERLVQAASLRAALLGGGMAVAFQPQMDAVTRRPIGLEALIRWTHAGTGPVAPERIVSLATSAGLLSELTEMVVEKAMSVVTQAEALGHVLSVSVNLTARQLSDTALLDVVRNALARHRLSPERLILEVTESALMVDARHAPVVLAELRRLGVRLSIDDFGTGYSSLAQLQRLAPQELKIDRSFVARMGMSTSDRTIVRSTLDLGHSLGLLVVAEGVETIAIAETLTGWGCDLLQGYAFARPLHDTALLAWLEHEASSRQGTSIPVPAPVTDLSVAGADPGASAPAVARAAGTVLTPAVAPLAVPVVAPVSVSLPLSYAGPRAVA